MISKAKESQMKRASISAAIAMATVLALSCTTPEPVTVIVEREVTRIVEVTSADPAQSAEPLPQPPSETADVVEPIRDPSERANWEDDIYWTSYFLKCFQLNPSWEAHYAPVIDVLNVSDEQATQASLKWRDGIIASDNERICGALKHALDAVPVN